MDVRILFKLILNQTVLATVASISCLAQAGTTEPIATSQSAIHDCLEPETVQDDFCRTVDQENVFDFQTSPILLHSVQIDVRPADCRSFFEDYLHPRRGLRIERALENIDYYDSYRSTVTTFPVVDFIDGGEIRVVKTRDLSADMFNNPNNPDALYDQILNDAESVRTDLLDKLGERNILTATVNGVTTTISRDDFDAITIDIIIQAGMASLAQIEQIQRAKLEIEKRWGFKLQILEIP